MTRGPILLLAGLALAGLQPFAMAGAREEAVKVRADLRVHGESGGGGLRDAARLAALIERLDAVRKAGDELPVHALELSLRKAVEHELAEGRLEHTRGREVRLQSASRIGLGDAGSKRDETYRTPLTSSVDPNEVPKAGSRKEPGRKRSTLAEADFERRRRAVLDEMARLDEVLDEAGLNARRRLLLELLEIARARDLLRNQREPTGD